MGNRVYIETSIISYLIAWPSPNVVMAASQEITCNWWEARRSHYELFVSELVVLEASRGDQDAAKRRLEKLEGIAQLEVTPEALSLAKRLVDEGALPTKAFDDATHLAVTAINEIDYLLTWNCRHLDNAEKKSMMRKVCATAGYSCPEICTPQELMGEQADE